MASSERRSTLSMAAELALSGAASAVFSVSTLLAENPDQLWLTERRANQERRADQQNDRERDLERRERDNVRLCCRPVPLRLPASLSTRFKSGGAASAGTSANSTLVGTPQLANAAIRQSIQQRLSLPSSGKSVLRKQRADATNPSASQPPPATDNSTPSARTA